MIFSDHLTTAPGIPSFAAIGPPSFNFGIFHEAGRPSIFCTPSVPEKEGKGVVCMYISRI